MAMEGRTGTLQKDVAASLDSKRTEAIEAGVKLSLEKEKLAPKGLRQKVQVGEAAEKRALELQAVEKRSGELLRLKDAKKERLFIDGLIEQNKDAVKALKAGKVKPNELHLWHDRFEALPEGDFKRAVVARRERMTGGMALQAGTTEYKTATGRAMEIEIKRRKRNVDKTITELETSLGSARAKEGPDTSVPLAA